MANELKNQVVVGFFWSFLERLGNQGVSFLVSIVLARILMPADFGLVAIVMVFVSLSNVFVQGGFGNALIQKKEVDELDCSSVFWLSLAVSFLFYLMLFVSAPWIAHFYGLPVLSPMLRTLGLLLPVNSYGTVLRAIVSRSMQFRTFFYSSITGVIISALIGIWLAYRDGTVWALVVQQLTNAVVGTFVIAIFVKWYPRRIFRVERVKGLFSYGWKLQLGILIDSLYDNFRSLYVGKLYTPADLAYYTRGKNFPSLVVNNVNSSLMTVLFPALSKRQDDRGAVRNMVRRSIRISSFVIIPLMFGLIAIAKPLVLVLLTEKWIPCVVFLQILCLDLMLMPVQTANLQAIHALGRTDIGLRLNIIKKFVGFVIVLVTATYSVEAMAWGSVVSAIFASVMNTWPNKHLLGYGYLSQMKDILPFFMLAGVMSAIVYLTGLLPISSLYISLGLQVAVGIIVYVGLSALFHLESFSYIRNLAAGVIGKIPNV